MSTRQLLDQLLQQGQNLAREAASRVQGGQAPAPGQTGGTPAGAGGNASLSGLIDMFKGGSTPGQAGGGSGGQTGGLGGIADKLGGLLGGGGLGGALGGGQAGGHAAGGSGGQGAAGGLGSLLSGFGGGALSGGAVGLLLGNKRLRKSGGKIVMYGGMAALGVLAYKAYGNWQRQQGQTNAPEPQTMDRLPPAQAEQHSAAVLSAMIAAAKADGHIGDDERQALEGELTKLSDTPADRQWLQAELSRPLDPATVARLAETPEMAAEMYIASLLVVDEESYMERAYLDELARQLKIEPSLKAQLEAQVSQPA